MADSWIHLAVVLAAVARAAETARRGRGAPLSRGTDPGGGLEPILADLEKLSGVYLLII